MNGRIQKLRDQSLNAVNRISHERALLVTEFYQSDIANQVSIPMQRALAFNHILGNKYFCINEGELIIGERGEALIRHGECHVEALEHLASKEKNPDRKSELLKIAGICKRVPEGWSPYSI